MFLFLIGTQGRRTFRGMDMELMGISHMFTVGRRSDIRLSLPDRQLKQKCELSIVRYMRLSGKGH